MSSCRVIPFNRDQELQGILPGVVSSQAPQAQCEGTRGQQKYKDLYGNPDKKPEKIILRKNCQLKSLTLLPLWVASFLCGFFPDSTRIKPLSVHRLSTVPHRGSHVKRGGMLVGNFKLNLKSIPIWAWPSLFLTPKRDHIKTQRNKKYSDSKRWQRHYHNASNTFTYVKKYKSVHLHFYISSRATLKETFYLWLRFA